MSAVTDLWSLTWGQPHIDADHLAAAIEHEASHPDQLDFRTRLLIRDSVKALEQYWGASRTQHWLEESPNYPAIQSILQADLGPAGFPSLKERVMTHIDPEKVLEYLRTIASRVTSSTRLTIGGSIALILARQLSRATEDIDIVDEIPAPIRSQHDLLADLSKRFGLQLTHFQSHYLPSGWENRLHSLGVFGPLQVVLVDTIDIFLSKLFSHRDKDIDDLRALKPQVDLQRLTDRLLDTAAALLAQPALKKYAQDNWYMLYGQPLPERSPA